jgi:ATP-dependent Lon protease
MSNSRSLVASPPLGLPIAQMRSVFNAEEVERRLAKLQASGNEREHEGLRNTWQRMLERGPRSSHRVCPTWPRSTS